VRIVEPADGAFIRAERAGRACVESTPTEHGGCYLYFDLDPSFAFEADPQPMRITVEYLDAGCDVLQLEYDSLDPGGSVREGAFKAGGRVEIGGTGEWRSAQFDLDDARFADRANGADFRFAVQGAGELALAAVRVEKLGD